MVSVFYIGSVCGKALGEAALLEAGAGAQPPAGGHHINYFTCADYKTLSCRDVPKHPFLWAFFFFFFLGAGPVPAAVSRGNGGRFRPAPRWRRRRDLEAIGRGLAAPRPPPWCGGREGRGRGVP